MLTVGTTLKGMYRVERQLASGGFGNTYEVVSLAFNERFALKEFFLKGVNEREKDMMTVSVSNGQNNALFEEQLAKFKKEAQRLHELHNDHIVKVHAMFEDNGTAYYIMDFIEGCSLSEKLKATKCPLPENEVRQILIQLLDALGEIHQNKLWHMDLKPANVMVDKNGKAVLIDFGASKQLNPDGGATTSTALCYTPGYAPSEQVEQSMGKCGPWTDLYALGATLFNLLTNQKPPLSSDISESPDEAFAPLQGVSQEMQTLVRWLMQPPRTQRPQSVQEVLDYLNGQSADQQSEQTVIATMKSPVIQTDSVVQTDTNNSVQESQPVQNNKPVGTKKPANIEKLVEMEKPVDPKEPVKPAKKNSLKFIFIGVSIWVAVVVAAAIMLLKTKTKAPKTLEEEVAYYQEFHDLPTELDTFAYALGVSITTGMDEYLSQNEGIDSTLAEKEDVCMGMLVGAEVTDGLLESTNTAINAGIKIGEQFKSTFVNYSKDIFRGDSTKTIPIKPMMAGVIQGYMKKSFLYTPKEAYDVYARLYKIIKGISPEELSNKEKGEAFLQNKRMEAGVHEIPNSGGVLYKVIKEGTGKKPSATSDVTVDYELRLIDGTVIDSSYQRGERLTTRLDYVISGWSSALQLMPEGSEWEVYIPYDQAYGENDIDMIPPYSALIFKVRLYSVNDNAM